MASDIFLNAAYQFIGKNVIEYMATNNHNARKCGLRDKTGIPEFAIWKQITNKRGNHFLPSKRRLQNAKKSRILSSHVNIRYAADLYSPDIQR